MLSRKQLDSMTVSEMKKYAKEHKIKITEKELIYYRLLEKVTDKVKEEKEGRKKVGKEKMDIINKYNNHLKSFMEKYREGRKYNQFSLFVDNNLTDNNVQKLKDFLYSYKTLEKKKIKTYSIDYSTFENEYYFMVNYKWIGVKSDRGSSGAEILASFLEAIFLDNSFVFLLRAINDAEDGQTDLGYFEYTMKIDPKEKILESEYLEDGKKIIIKTDRKDMLVFDFSDVEKLFNMIYIFTRENINNKKIVGDKVLNPLTGKNIERNGKTHLKLIKQGKMI